GLGHLHGVCCAVAAGDLAAGASLSASAPPARRAGDRAARARVPHADAHAPSDSRTGRGGGGAAGIGGGCRAPAAPPGGGSCAATRGLWRISSAPRGMERAP